MRRRQKACCLPHTLESALPCAQVFTWRKDKLRRRTGSGTAAKRPFESTIQRALQGETHAFVNKDSEKKDTERRGRKRAMSPQERGKLARTLSGLETANKFESTSAKMVCQKINDKRAAKNQAPLSVAVVTESAPAHS